MTRDEHDLMDVFLRCIAVDDDFAHEIAVAARQCGRDGNHAVANALMSISRNHRIRGMEGRAQLAALEVGPCLGRVVDRAGETP
jgi:hypothetical protein